MGHPAAQLPGLPVLQNANRPGSAVDLNRGPVGDFGEVAADMADERYAATARALFGRPGWIGCPCVRVL